MSDPPDGKRVSPRVGPQRAVARVCVVCATAAVVGALWWHDPAGSRVFPPCPFRWLTDLRCPGCGTLRAMHQLLHGQIAAAFYLNPLAMLALPPLAIWGVSRIGLRLGVVRSLWRPLPPWIPWLVLAVILAFWVLRNLPWAPFVWFAA